MVKGAAPRIENQMTGFRPNLSPISPPRTVPIACEARKTKRQIWESLTEMELVDEEKGEVVRHACGIEILGKHQHKQDENEEVDFAAGNVFGDCPAFPDFSCEVLKLLDMPPADV